jgi:hypothetical protein
MSANSTDTAKLHLDQCKGCGAVGLVEVGEVPMCGRCLPNAYAIHLAEETVRRAAETNS